MRSETLSFIGRVKWLCRKPQHCLYQSWVWIRLVSYQNIPTLSLAIDGSCTCSCGHCPAAVKWRNTMWTLGLVSKDLKTPAKKNGTSRCCLAICQDKETCRFLGTRGHVKGIFLLSKAHQNIPEGLFIYLFSVCSWHRLDWSWMQYQH